MSDIDFPSNSKTNQKQRKAPKQRQSVVVRDDEELAEEGRELVRRKVITPIARRPRVKKKAFLERAASSLFGGETDNVGQYILWDVLIPAAKTTIQDMVTSGIEMLLFGEASGRGSRRERDRGKTIVSYGGYFRNPGRYDRKEPSRDMVRVPGHHNRLNGIVFESRGEAEEAMNALVDLLDEYEVVSIADFYEIAGLDNVSQFTDNAWGWNNLSKVRIMHTRDGYEIDFPKPMELD